MDVTAAAGAGENRAAPREDAMAKAHGVFGDRRRLDELGLIGGRRDDLDGVAAGLPQTAQHVERAADDLRSDPLARQDADQGLTALDSTIREAVHPGVLPRPLPR